MDQYYEKSLQLLRKGGLAVIDNVSDDKKYLDVGFTLVMDSAGVAFIKGFLVLRKPLTSPNSYVYSVHFAQAGSPVFGVKE